MYFLFFGFDLAPAAMLFFNLKNIYFIFLNPFFLFWGFWFGFVLYSHVFCFSFLGVLVSFCFGNVVFFSFFPIFFGYEANGAIITRRFLPNLAINEI